MNILITSGSTVDFVDSVHYVSNVSDGSLAANIGEELSKQIGIDKVFYVCGKKTKYPWQHSTSNDQKFFLDEWLDKIAIYPVDDIEQLEDTVHDIFGRFQIDAVVHLMSIVNYGKSKIHLIDNKKDAADFISEIAKTYDLTVDIKDDFSSFTSKTIDNNRILSGFDRLFIEQTPTKKILKLFKELKSDIKIISSKIESGVSYEKLILDSKNSLGKNGSDLVFAIDLKECEKEGENILYVVSKNDETKRLKTSDSISNYLIEYIKE